MIKIYDKIWTIQGASREDGLAYMCQYEEDSAGKPKANIEKMQTTGRNWARCREHKVFKKRHDATQDWHYEYDENGEPILLYVQPAQEGTEALYENKPTTGFYIGDSVERWSTSNKLFRVTDPRGFTVEVSTGNISTLLHHCSVIKGVVQEECLWGRDGANHVLLPVNSKPYLETLKKMDQLENIIPFQDLKPGDWVRMFEDNKEYCYLGRIKMKWQATFPKRTPYPGGSWSWYTGPGSVRSVANLPDLPAQEFEDTKWRHAFIWSYKHQKDIFYIETPSKSKVVEVKRNEEKDWTKEINKINHRMSNPPYYDGYQTATKLISYKVK